MRYLKVCNKLYIKLSFILVFLFISLFSLNVAYARSYNVDNYNVNIQVNDNGSLDIIEEITYDFSGNYEGIYRNFFYRVDETNGNDIYPKSSIYMGSGMSKVKAYVFNNVLGDYIEARTASIENHIKMEESDYTNGMGVKLYSKSSNELKKFKFEYTVNNIVVNHNDISEFYWNLVNDEQDIKKANVKIVFPQELNKDKTYVFPHYTGKNVNSKVEGNTIYITAENIKGDTYLDARIVFEKNILTNISKNTGKDNLDNILFLEEKLDKPTKEGIYKLIIISVGAVIVIISSITAIKNYKKLYEKYGKKYDVPEGPESQFDIPNRERSPLEVSYMQSSYASNKDLIAIILDLIDRKYINMELQKEITKKGKEKYRYILTKNEVYKPEDLKGFEKEIYNFIFKEEEKVDLDDRLKKIENSEAQYQNFNYILLRANKEIDKEIFEHPKPQPKEIKILPLIISAIVLIISIIVAIVIPDAYGYSHSMSIGNNISNYIVIFITLISTIMITIIGFVVYNSKGKFGSFITALLISLIVTCIVNLLIPMQYNYEYTRLNLILLACILTGFIWLFGILIANLSFKRMKKDYEIEKYRWLALKKYIEEYSYIKDREAAHLVNWGPYMVYAMALGVADKLNKELNIMYRETGEVMPMYMNYYAIHIAMNSHITRASSTSGGSYSGGSGGHFSGGGGGGRRKFWRSFLVKYKK